MPPNLYRHTNSGNTVQAAKSNTFWTNEVIYEILKNRVYCGDMVQGRSRTKQHSTTWTQPSEWTVTENTHVPIVSRELFDIVQNKKGKIKFSRENAAVNVFAKKLYCGHCGFAIHHEKRQNRDAYYFCTSRKAHGKDACVPVSISGTELKTRVLEVLRKPAAVFADMRERQIPISESDDAQAELTRTKQELDRTSGFLKGLYESLIEGDITNTEYAEMKQSYESRIATLNERANQLRGEIRERYLRESELKKALGNLDNVSVISGLTAEVMDTLIERILLFGDKSIEVTFKFTDETEGLR
jgi:hypothetical protein